MILPCLAEGARAGETAIPRAPLGWLLSPRGLPTPTDPQVPEVTRQASTERRPDATLDRGLSPALIGKGSRNREIGEIL